MVPLAFMVKKIFTKSLFSHTLSFDRLYTCENRTKARLNVCTKKELGNYLNPISTGLFYLIVALEGGFHKVDPDILEH